MTFIESTATLRATGGFRYVSAAFLTVWLVGWAIGEAVALASPPPGWEVQVGEDDCMQLRRVEQRARPAQALILWCVSALVTLGWIAGMRVDVSNRPGFAAYVLTLGLVAGSAWLTWGRSQWLVRPGRLAFRRQFGPWISERPFEHAQLAIECSNDSDGDDAYSLIVRAGSDHRTIHRVVNDDGEIVDCARWLAAHTGFPLVGGAVRSPR